MLRPPFGIYAVGDRIVRAGRRDRAPRGGEAFHAIALKASRAALDNADELDDIRWTGATIVRRPQAAIDARIRARAIVVDAAHFEREREKAVLLVLLDEINVLRQAAGLPPRTVTQAKAAYKRKLNR